MCDKHGKLIDTDETRFSTELLKSWKTLAENVDSLMLQKGIDYKTSLKLLNDKKLVDNSIRIIKLGIENETIGNLINDSCLMIVWSNQIADAIRDFAIEHFRNSFQHGKATYFDIQIIDDKIIFTDDGEEFIPQKLMLNNKNTGGTISIKNLILQFSDKIIFNTQRIKGVNKTIITILKEATDIFAVTPCSVQLTFEDFHLGNSSINISETCYEFYVILPPYFALSDVRFMPRKFPQFEKSGKLLVFIVEHISDGVRNLLTENYPESRIIGI